MICALCGGDFIPARSCPYCFYAAPLDEARTMDKALGINKAPKTLRQQKQAKGKTPPTVW